MKIFYGNRNYLFDATVGWSDKLGSPVSEVLNNFLCKKASREGLEHIDFSKFRTDKIYHILGEVEIKDDCGPECEVRLKKFPYRRKNVKTMFEI